VFLSILAEVGLVQDAATLLQRMQQRQRRRRGGPAPAPRLQGQQGQTSEALANLSQRLRVYVVVAVDICFEVAQQGAEMLRLTAPPATEPRAGGSGGGGGAASATAAAGGALLLARGQAVAVLRQLEQAQAQCTRSLQLEVQSIHEGHAALLSPLLPSGRWQGERCREAAAPLLHIAESFSCHSGNSRLSPLLAQSI
jgi:hypothetical protein